MDLMLVARQLDLCVGHEVKNDDDAATCVGDDGLSGVHDRDPCSSNQIEQSEIVLENLTAARSHHVRVGISVGRFVLHSVGARDVAK